jgi:peptidoglycan/xylan/chitin deacetylase (PgdA/CDA1 family)
MPIDHSASRHRDVRAASRGTVLAGVERILIRPLLHGAVRASGILAVARRLDTRPNTLRVLVYHRIVAPDEPLTGDPTLISATPDMFAAQLRYLAEYYTLVGGQQVLDAVRGEAPLPPRSVLVTFDDGYRDFLTHAWPVLRAHGAPAVLFIPTGFPGRDCAFWWDALHAVVAATERPHAELPLLGATPLRTRRERQVAIRRLNRRLRPRRPDEITTAMSEIQTALDVPVPVGSAVLSWDELRELVRDGLMVAPHTRNHPAIPALRPEEAVEEIRQAGADLRREIGVVPPLFAYPFGMMQPWIEPLLEAEGMSAAFTMVPGANVMGIANRWRLCRRAVNGGKSLTDFALSLVSSYARLQHWHWNRMSGGPT